MNSPSTPKTPASYPLAYTEGNTWFYGRKFALTPSVLIPRPETEVIIDTTKKIARTLTRLSSCEGDSQAHASSEFLRSSLLHILDIGTGSGIIAITLALELPEADITATDISPPALALAKQNANHHKVQISFLEADLLSEVTGTYDIITANLPYVDPTWPWLDKPTLSHEPQIALYAKDQGLSLIKKLIRQIRPDPTKPPTHLTEQGTLILEHDPCQFPALAKYAKEHNFTPKSISPYITVLCRPPAPPLSPSPPHPSAPSAPPSHEQHTPL